MRIRKSFAHSLQDLTCVFHGVQAKIGSWRQTECLNGADPMHTCMYSIQLVFEKDVLEKEQGIEHINQAQLIQFADPDTIVRGL